MDPLPGPVGGVVTYEVRVQHPLSFDWRTVKSFDSETLAAEYARQIENRYWVVYGNSPVQFLEAANQADARSKANALQRAGTYVKAVAPIQVQVGEESFQALFDDAAQPALAGPAPQVPNELQPLLGLWEAATQNADGQVSRILLNLNGDGTADLTVPTAAGGEVKIKRDFAIDDDGIFKLTGGPQDLVLGEVVEAGAEKVVLDRNGAKVTFLRPQR